MVNKHEFPSVHPYLNYVANFIVDTEKFLEADKKMSANRETALKAIGHAIRILSPDLSIRCQRGYQVNGIKPCEALSATLKE